MEIEHAFCKNHIIRRRNSLIRMLMMRQHNLLKNLLELITSYIYIVDQAIFLIQVARFEQFQ
jgi:hypothetical protein